MYFKRHQLIQLAVLSKFGPTKHRIIFLLCQLKMQVLCVSTWTVKLLISIRKNDYDKKKGVLLAIAYLEEEGFKTE